jgi:hypothetical protein
MSAPSTRWTGTNAPSTGWPGANAHGWRPLPTRAQPPETRASAPAGGRGSSAVSSQRSGRATGLGPAEWPRGKGGRPVGEREVGVELGEETVEGRQTVDQAEGTPGGAADGVAREVPAGGALGQVSAGRQGGSAFEKSAPTPLTRGSRRAARSVATASSERWSPLRSAQECGVTLTGGPLRVSCFGRRPRRASAGRGTRCSPFSWR